MTAASSDVTAPRPKPRRWAPYVLLALFVAAVSAGAVYTDSLRPLPDPLKPLKGWEYWTRPVERNAFLRLPVLTGSLHGMDVSADGRVVVLVGAEDFLLTSPDAGRTWTRGTLGASEAPARSKPSGAFNFDFRLLGSAHALERGSRAQKAPQGGTALPPAAAPPPIDKSARPKRKSDPSSEPEVAGVETSAPVEPARPNTRMLFGVRIIDERTYVAVGDAGLILRTDDAGRSWSIRPSSTQETLRAVACSGKVCLAVGGAGTVVRSDDAGQSWSAAATGTSQLNVIVPLGSERWLAADSSKIYKLDAHGQLVSAVEIPDAGKFLLNEVAFHPDHKRGIATTLNGRVLITKDAGESWQSMASSARDLHHVAFNASGRAFAIVATDDAAFAVQSSDDLGEHWSVDGPVLDTYVTPRQSDTRLNIAARGDLYVLTGDNALLRMSPEGLWSRQSLGAAFRELAMLASGRGVVVGGDGVVLTTEDGGETWEPRDSGVHSDLTSVLFTDSHRAMAVGQVSPGVVQVIHSDDAGASWRGGPRIGRLSAFADTRLRFADPKHVYLRTGYSTAESTDGGSSWTTPTDGVIELGFADAQNGVRTQFGTDMETGLHQIDAYGTKDAGASWERIDGAHALWFDRGGRKRYALTGAAGSNPVGFPGSLQVPENAVELLRRAQDAAFNEDAVGLAITDQGGLLRLPKDGTGWTAIANPTNAPLRSVRFAGKERVVALAPGRIAVSDDAGASFRALRYRRLPSRWLWVASLLLVGGVLLYARSSINAPSVAVGPPSIADAAASDRPIQWWDPDHAGLRDIALGLSRFLRNRKTDPPLTLAITGEWGTGKSSLMNLLRYDLERYGYKPVWFNAWHHQSGENLLGSLLANIHAQGVPGFLSIPGLDFRLSLTWIRGRRLWLRAALLVMLFAIVVSSHAVLKDKWATFWTTFTKNGQFDFSSFGAATGLIGIAVSVITPLLGVVRAASAFGLQPAKLIAAVASTTQDESARNQAGARFRFAQEFKDFTVALEPRPLVVFIDDLDRCSAPHVVEALEAVSFLVSSGRCIVVLGMARRWVERCVGLAFKELAQVQVDEVERGHATARSDEQQRFARHYLEKLINIEIRVPQLSAAGVSALLRGAEPQDPQQNARYMLGTALYRSVIVGGMLIAMAIPVYAGYWIGQSFKDMAVPQALEPEAVTPAVTHAVNPATTVTSTTAPDTKKVAESAAPARVEPSRVTRSSAWYWGGGFLAVGAMITLGLLALFARREARTDDSADFQDALRILQPFILFGGSSPRSLKRFINHVRYLAMRTRPQPDASSAYERLMTTLRKAFGRSTPEPSSPVSAEYYKHLSEPLLVLLAALQRCDETWLQALTAAEARTALETVVREQLAARESNPAQRAAALDKLLEAIDQFKTHFSSLGLFFDAAQDRARVLAFYELMALDTDASRGEPNAADTSTSATTQPSAPAIY